MTDRSGRLSLDQLDAAVELMGRGRRHGILPMQGDSMLPTLCSGQLIAVDFFPDELVRGDLLLFRQQDYLVVHRLLGAASARDGTLRTRGDGSPGLDPPLERRRVRGRVFAVHDGDRWWDLEGGAARAYALGLAVHDLCWAAAAAMGTRTDRVLVRVGARGRFAAWAAAADRRLLGAVHRLLFRAAHRPSAAPPLGFEP